MLNLDGGLRSRGRSRGVPSKRQLPMFLFTHTHTHTRCPAQRKAKFAWGQCASSATRLRATLTAYDVMRTILGWEKLLQSMKINPEILQAAESCTMEDPSRARQCFEDWEALAASACDACPRPRFYCLGISHCSFPTKDGNSAGTMFAMRASSASAPSGRPASTNSVF